MLPDKELQDRGLLIVTGSTIRAEKADRMLAYRLKDTIEQTIDGKDECNVVVLSDLWYLNSESLQKLPTISVGGPTVNALAAHLFKQLPNTLIVDRTLLIQMDPTLEDLRASVWGAHQDLTVSAVELFIERGYLEQFLEASMAHFS